MKISTRGRYGLKAMAEFAEKYSADETNVLSLNAVSEKHGISESYLEQIINPLKKAGLLKSIRGAGGGYVLSRAPDTITVGEILRLVEGSLSPAECLDGGDVCGGGTCRDCAAKPVLGKLFDAVNGVVDSVTLSDIANLNDNKKEIDV
ncbi:AsnC family transcriptional regulator [Clostridia bacterium]|nr:AsnC family transcriptional regulator [Clostridia bacterium]